MTYGKAKSYMYMHAKCNLMHCLFVLPYHIDMIHSDGVFGTIVQMLYTVFDTLH